MDLLFEHTIRRQQAENERLRTQVQTLAHDVSQMTGMMERLALTAPPPSMVFAGDTAIVGNKNVVLQDRRVVNVNVFGNENTDHITSAKIREVLEECLQLDGIPQAAKQAVMKAAMLIYSDPEHPENFTCYVPNKREGSALVHGVGGWEVRPLKVVTVPMAKRAIDILFDKQPYEDAETFEPLMKELRDNEAKYSSGAEMRAILVGNKDNLNAVFARARAEASLSFSN